MVWIPPHASTGLRRPPTRSKGSFRGSRIGADNRELVTESHLESNVSYWLEARRDVIHLRDQWPAVTYVDLEGKRRSHTFDFHVVMADGRRKAVAVKPFEKVDRGLRQIMMLIRQQGSLDGFADEAVIITENDVAEVDARNARSILRARQLRDDREYRAARADVARMRGTVRFYDLVKASEEQARRRNAVWCLIDEGILLPVNERAKIADNTVLRVNRANH